MPESIIAPLYLRDKKEKVTKRKEALSLFSFVIPLGFEPKTHSLEGCCSIQLSYGTIISRAKV